jgi:hypothetical protein
MAPIGEFNAQSQNPYGYPTGNRYPRDEKKFKSSLSKTV